MHRFCSHSLTSSIILTKQVCSNKGTDSIDEAVALFLKSDIPSVITQILCFPPEPESLYLYQLLFYIIAGYALHRILSVLFLFISSDPLVLQ